MKKVIKTMFFLTLLIFVVMFKPQNVLATDDIDKNLEEGELVVKTIPPKDEEESYLVSEIIYEKLNGDYYIDNFVSPYLKCTIKNYQDSSFSKEVEIVYDYDKNVKKVVDGIIAKLSAGQKNFELTDIEYIAYLLENAEKEEPENLSNYCGELKQFIDYKNFIVEPRAGDDIPSMMEYVEGTANFVYEGTNYAFVKNMGVIARNVIYVDENTTDISLAIKNKMSKYFGKVTVYDEDQPSVQDLINKRKDEYGSIYDNNIDYYISEGYKTKEEYVEKQMNELFYNDNAVLNCITKAEENTCVVEFSDGLKLQFIIVKDSEKAAKETNLITSDVGSNITISTTSKSIPLDTLIKVAKITSGDEYNKIVEILENTNVEIYDLKLFSKTVGENITKLDDGMFEVKIPISEAFKGKKLVAYYVDNNNNNKAIEYEVTLKEGYAIFYTNHFSIYTLAAVGDEEIKKEDNKVEEPKDDDEKVDDKSKLEKDETPKTGTENVLIQLIILASVSFIGIIVLKNK